MDWAVALVTAVVLVGLMVAAVVLGQSMGEDDDLLGAGIALLGLIGVPLSICVGTMKVGVLRWVFAPTGDCVVEQTWQRFSGGVCRALKFRCQQPFSRVGVKMNGSNRRLFIFYGRWCIETYARSLYLESKAILYS